MSAPVQAQLALRCARCGRDLVPLEELANAAVRAGRAYEAMRIAIPDDLRTGVRLLARGLPCHVGACAPEAA